MGVWPAYRGGGSGRTESVLTGSWAGRGEEGEREAVRATPLPASGAGGGAGELQLNRSGRLVDG